MKSAKIEGSTEEAKIGAFESWCQRLESPSTCKNIKPVIPKGNQPSIFPGTSPAEAEAPIFGHLMQRANSLEKTLKMGKIEGKRRRRKQRMRRWNSLTNSMDMNLNKLGDGEGQKSLVCCSLCSGKELNVVQ